MKRLILLVSIIAILFSYPMNVLASNIINAIYSGTIVVTNNSTSAVNTVAANMTLSSADLISQGYVTSNFSNAVIRNNSGSDVPFMPSVNSSYPWLMWVPSIAASSVTNYILYAGGPDMSSTKSYFPGTAGANVTDAASMEPSNNFSLALNGYLDTSKTGNLINKTNAVVVSSNGSGNVSATVYALHLSNNATNTRDAPVGNGSVIRQGERLNSVSYGAWNTVNFTLKKTNLPTGTANITIRKVSDDSILAYFGTIDVSTIGAAYADYTFSFNGTGSAVNPITQDLRVQIEYVQTVPAAFVQVLGQNTDA